MNTNRSNYWLSWIPITGIILFIILYTIAASYYPGGTFNEKNTVGYDWRFNYWCELLSPFGKNGEVNRGRLFALAGMIVLSLSLAVFWWQASFLFPEQSNSRKINRYSGILSMLASASLPLAPHDMTINVAGVLGVTAMIFTMIAIYRRKWVLLFVLGLVCIVLVLLNNYVYYTGNFIFYLPIIQKITFLLFLFWFALTSFSINRRLSGKV